MLLKMVQFTDSKQNTPFLQLVDSEEHTSHALALILALETVLQWSAELDLLMKIWNSFSSIPLVFMDLDV